MWITSTMMPKSCLKTLPKNLGTAIETLRTRGRA
jgi:hypothetical protein